MSRFIAAMLLLEQAVEAQAMAASVGSEKAKTITIYG
jgi:hypothetical protein